MMLAIVCVAMSKNVYAYDFEVDGIYYNILSSTDLTVAVAPKNGEDRLGPDGSLNEKAPYNKDAYKGIVYIPEKVNHLGQEYEVKTIYPRAFINCSELIEAVIPGTVEAIGEDAFWGCSQLKRLIIPKSVKAIAFYRTEYKWQYRDYFYYGCFAECRNIEELRVEEGNSVYDSRGNCNAIIHTGSNTLVLGIANTVKIPKTVLEFGTCSFVGNDSMRKLVIEDSRNQLEIEARFANYSIDSLYIGRPLITKNVSRCFYSLKYVQIGEYVNTMGSDNLFNGCENIQSIDCFNPIPPAVNSLAGELLYDSIILNIPKGSLEEYKSHVVWRKFKNIVEKFNIVHDTEHSILYDQFIYLNSDSTCILVNTVQDSYGYGINRIYNDYIKGYRFRSVGDGKNPLEGTLSISLPASIQEINDYSLSKITGGADYLQIGKDYKIKIPIENELKYIGAYALPADPFDRFRLHINKDCLVNQNAFATKGLIISNRSNLTIDPENPYVGLDKGVLFYKDSVDIVRYFVHQTSSDVVVIPAKYTTIDHISTSDYMENIEFEDASFIKYLRLTNCNIINDEYINFENIDTISNEIFTNCNINTKKIEFSNAKYFEESFCGNYKHLVFRNVEKLHTGHLFSGRAQILSIYANTIIEPYLINNAIIGRLNWLNEEIPFVESIDYCANQLNVLNLGSAISIGRLGMMYAMKNRSMSILLSTSTPPEVLSMVLFDDYPSKVKLYVPIGSGDTYRNHEKWGIIPTIIEYDVNGPDPTSGIHAIVNDDVQSVVDVYNLQGVCVRKGVQRGEATQGLPQGIYIINGEKVLVK